MMNLNDRRIKYIFASTTIPIILLAELVHSSNYDTISREHIQEPDYVKGYMEYQVVSGYDTTTSASITPFYSTLINSVEHSKFLE